MPRYVIVHCIVFCVLLLWRIKDSNKGLYQSFCGAFFFPVWAYLTLLSVYEHCLWLYIHISIGTPIYIYRAPVYLYQQTLIHRVHYALPASPHSHRIMQFPTHAYDYPSLLLYNPPNQSYLLRILAIVIFYARLARYCRHCSWFINLPPFAMLYIDMTCWSIQMCWLFLRRTTVWNGSLSHL